MKRITLPSKYQVIRGAAITMASLCALYGAYVAIVQGLDTGSVKWAEYRGLMPAAGVQTVETTKTIYVVDKAESDQQVKEAVSEALK